MKTLRILALAFSIVIIAGACNCNSQADKWSSEQKAAWTENCMEFMAQQGVDKKDAVGFCDCMFEKTSEKYTPEQAAAITEQEERKLWDECDFSW